MEVVELGILPTLTKLNLDELKADDISAKFTAKSTKKYIPIR